MIDKFLALWLIDIQQSRNIKTLYIYLPAIDLKDQYSIWFSLHWTKDRLPNEILGFSIYSAMASN